MKRTDAGLVERARRGDSDAFEALVRRHLGVVRAVALGELGEAADADDVCQDVFVVALERLDELRRADRFGAWVRRIARNRARDLHRRRAVRAAEPMEEAHGLAGRADPARDAARSELRDRLDASLRELSPVRRTVLLLHDAEGWKHREIAEELALPVGTVRSHLHYARRTIRTLLGRGSSEEDPDG